MSFYGAMKVTYVEGNSEEDLQKRIRLIEAAHDGMIKVINIYRSGKKVVAWYYHDYKKAGAPPKRPTAVSPKKVD